MTDPIVPEAAQIAAKRAFIRTTAQGYATSITGSLVLSIVSLLTNPGDWLLVVVAVITAIVTPLAAGAAAYWQWIAKGIPEAYTAAAISTPAVLDDVDVLQKVWQAQVARAQAAIDANQVGGE